MDNTVPLRGPCPAPASGLRRSARHAAPGGRPEAPMTARHRPGRAFGPNTLQWARRRPVDNLWTKVDNTRRAVEPDASTVDAVHTTGGRVPARPPLLPRTVPRRPPPVHRLRCRHQHGCQLSTEFTSAKTTNQGDSWRGTSTHTHPTDPIRTELRSTPTRGCPRVRRPGSPGPLRSRTVVQAGRNPAGLPEPGHAPPVAPRDGRHPTSRRRLRRAP